MMIGQTYVGGGFGNRIHYGAVLSNVRDVGPGGRTDGEHTRGVFLGAGCLKKREELLGQLKDTSYVEVKDLDGAAWRRVLEPGPPGGAGVADQNIQSLGADEVLHLPDQANDVVRVGNVGGEPHCSAANTR